MSGGTGSAVWDALRAPGVLAVRDLADRIGCSTGTVLRYVRAWALAGEVCLDGAGKDAIVTLISGDARAPDVYGDGVMTYVSSHAEQGGSVHIEGTPARPRYVSRWRRDARGRGSIQWTRSFLEEPMPVGDETHLPGPWQVMRGGRRRYWWGGALGDLELFLEPGDVVVDREGRPAGVGGPPPREAADEIVPEERGWIAEGEPAQARGVALAVSDVIGHEPPRTSMEAIARIRAWRSAMASLSAIAEAEVMAACWLIRREHQTRAAFISFFRRHDPDQCISGEHAWLMAETWEVSRRQRSLRELTTRRPDEAIAFVREFVDAGREADLEELDANDRKVAEILSSAPRRRSARIRALIESHEERLALEPPEAPPPPPDPALQATGLEKVIGELRSAVMRLEALTGVVAGLPVEPALRAEWGRVLALTDLGSGSLDTIAGVAAERAGG